MRKLKLMLIFSVSLLALFTLSACKMLTAHKKITNIKFTEKTFKESGTKTVAKIEYQTVGETEAESDIDYNTAFDLAVNQTATIKIAYYDNQNKLIATEYAPSIQDAIDQSHGIRSVMFYPESKGTHLEVSGKDEMTGYKSLSDTADFETASTLVGNATLKAVEIATQVDLPVFSDDSGVFIDALDGFPGVHSARWTGTHRDYANQNGKILDLMKNQTNRKAEYKTVVAFAHNNKINLFEGVMPLKVAHSESNTPGFSYDTIMKFNDTFVSEMNPVDKNKMSSRADAITKFKAFIEHYQL